MVIYTKGIGSKAASMAKANMNVTLVDIKVLSSRIESMAMGRSYLQMAVYTKVIGKMGCLMGKESCNLTI